MGGTVFAIVVTLALLWYSSVAVKDCINPQGNRRPSILANDVYDALVNLAEGKSQPPVKERTKTMRTAATRYWRGRRSQGEKNTIFRGRRMIKSSEVKKIVAEEFDKAKGSGAAKLACSLKDTFVGISRHRIQNILNTDKSHYRRNAKFMNKETLKPIRAKDVHIRHQIDLMDMGCKGSVKMNGQLYRYVLTILDIFSRFSNKSNK